MSTRTIKCPLCKGEGEYGEQTIYYGEEGMQIEADVPCVCPMCHGKKAATIEQINDYREEHGQDELTPYQIYQLRKYGNILADDVSLNDDRTNLLAASFNTFIEQENYKQQEGL